MPEFCIRSDVPVGQAAQARLTQYSYIRGRKTPPDFPAKRKTLAMSSTREFAPGNYRFIPGPFQYSGGVASFAGYGIQRVRLRRPVPLAQGFALASEIIRGAGRP